MQVISVLILFQPQFEARDKVVKLTMSRGNLFQVLTIQLQKKCLWCMKIKFTTMCCSKN